MLPAEATRELRHLRRPTRALTLLALSAALVAAGCGDEGDDGDDAGTPPASSTDVTFTLDADGPGGEKPASETVVCEGSGGTSHPVCPLVEEVPPDPGAAVPPDTACTEIYGGPDVLKVEGMLNGATIDATFSRANGCEIDRFDRFTPVLQDLFPGYQPGAAIGA